MVDMKGIYMTNPIVSVIIPLYNESTYIDRCLMSLVNQTYPIDKIEWLLIDGMSMDDTLDKARHFLQGTDFHILINEHRLVTYALNIGIQFARGRYVIRMDAHAEYAEDYIERCVYYLENTNAENVGGIALTKGIGFVGEANAEILSSKFGVGNSAFRTGEHSGYVDTVPFGAFRREVFDKIGMFNPELPRSEDNDFNSRIRKAGGKIYLASDISFTYYCRDTAKGLLRQGLLNGNALFLTLRKNPHAMSLRHYVPCLFVLSLLILPILSLIFPHFWLLLAVEGSLYISLDVFYSFRTEQIKRSLYKMIMYPAFHVVYGIGSFLGLLGIRLY